MKYAILLCLASVGCGHRYTKHVYLPDGTQAYAIGCGGRTQCLERLTKSCWGAYTIIEGTLPPPEEDRKHKVSLTFTCKEDQ